MSLILDALRKLDREKSSRRHGTSNIAVEILRPDLPRPLKRTPLYLVIVALTAVVTAGITYAVVKSYFTSKPSSSVTLTPPSMTQESPPGPEHSAKSQPPEPVQSPASSQPEGPAPLFQTKPSPPPVVNPPAPNQLLVPAPVSPEPVQGTRDEINRVPPKTEPPAEIKTAPGSPAEKEAGPDIILERAKVAPGNTEQPAERAPIGSTLEPPSLKLSAIVWHEEPSKRIAVINGMIAAEQSVIEGVKIVEIYPNRVRLSHNGRPFEILLK